MEHVAPRTRPSSRLGFGVYLRYGVFTFFGRIRAIWLGLSQKNEVGHRADPRSASWSTGAIDRNAELAINRRSKIAGAWEANETWDWWGLRGNEPRERSKRVESAESEIDREIVAAGIAAVIRVVALMHAHDHRAGVDRDDSRAIGLDLLAVLGSEFHSLVVS